MISAILEILGCLMAGFVLVATLADLVFRRTYGNPCRSHVFIVSANRCHHPKVWYWEDCGLSLKNEKGNIVTIAHPKFLSTEAERITIVWVWSKMQFNLKG